MRPSDDMHLMGEAYIGGVAPAGSNVTSCYTNKRNVINLPK